MQVCRFRYTEFSLTQLHHEYTQVYFSSRHLQVDVYIIYLSIYIYIYSIYTNICTCRCTVADVKMQVEISFLKTPTITSIFLSFLFGRQDGVD